MIEMIIGKVLGVVYSLLIYLLEASQSSPIHTVPVIEMESLISKVDKCSTSHFMLCSDPASTVLLVAFFTIWYESYNRMQMN